MKISKKSNETGVFLKKITKHKKLENHQRIVIFIQKDKVSFICKLSMSSIFFSQTKWTKVDIFKFP